MGICNGILHISFCLHIYYNKNFDNFQIKGKSLSCRNLLEGTIGAVPQVHFFAQAMVDIHLVPVLIYKSCFVVTGRYPAELLPLASYSHIFLD